MASVPRAELPRPLKENLGVVEDLCVNETSGVIRLEYAAENECVHCIGAIRAQFVW